MNTRSRLLASTVVLAALPLCALPALAQDVEDMFLGTIVIGESRRGIQTDTADSVTVITQEEIDARQASSMAELLDSVPNVALVNGSQPQGAAVSIRGLGTQSGTYGTDGKVAVVVDGVASGAEEIYRNGAMMALEPELFRTVTVTRGPAESFRYSSGAIGGTIEAETKEASDFLDGDDTFALRQKLGYESNGNGYSTSTILAFAPDSKLDVIAFLGYRSVGDRKDGSGTTQDATGFDQPSALLKANYAFNDAHKLTFSVSYNEVPEYDVPYNAYLPSWSDTLVDRETKDSTAYLAYRYNPIDNDLINVEARLTYKKEDMRIFDVAGTSTSGIYNADHSTETYALRLENEARFATGALGHSLLTGVEVKQRERSSTLLAGDYIGYNDASAPGGYDTSFSLYVTDEIALGDKLTLTPQLRYEEQTLRSEGNDYDAVSYTTVYGVPDGATYRAKATTGALSARYELTPDLAVFGSAAYNENLPILDDLRSDAYREQSEKARTFELGLSYDAVSVLTGSDALRAKFTAFDTAIWDGTTYSGVDSARLKGAEVELSYVHPSFYADVNAARTRGTINGTDEDYKWAPADALQVTLGKKMLAEQLDLSVEAKHAWAQNRTPDTNATYYPGTVPSQAYTVYTVSAGYTPNAGLAEGIEFRATVENLFDETYRPYLSTRNATGRSLKLSLSKTF
ncbi:TonB-dependent heme receptor A precursor [Aquimixticola soesokkakensis]|uniref:TonB-dependent heme receptor A n=1 Tax=Aquimixticola soesokkakensis TaxID=1519096 RepID=A0A1Y5THC9_9RHOB|nr:TonB-dependent receptor [Aquimixticola soesokkakensis]SLN60373.1 TonB-dependent heme receptor A precursor [Aquimixticola soesokkakensis]